MALIYEEYYKGSDKQEFLKLVVYYANLLSVDPDWLMAIMKVESGLNPKEFNDKNKGWNVGLIQFGASARKQISIDLGLPEHKWYKADDILKMSGSEQMKLVYLYYKPYADRKLITKFIDLYLITFYPNADGKFGGTLSKPKDWTFPDNVTMANPGIYKNKDIKLQENPDKISIQSLESWVLSNVDSKIRRSLETIKVGEVKVSEQKKTNNDDYIIYLHTIGRFKTLNEIVDYKRWIIPEQKTPPSANDIIRYKDNLEQIRKVYSKKENLEIKSGSEKDNIKVGTKLKIPVEWVGSIYTPFDGVQNVIPNDDVETFINKALLKATNNKQYKFRLNSGEVGGYVKKVLPKPRVLIYCKSLGILNDESLPKFSSEGAVLDLTPFITFVTTTTTKNGGVFSLSLPPLTCECTDTGIKIRQSSIRNFFTSGGENFQSKDFVNKVVNGEVKRNRFFFHDLISENDIVWISFDTSDDITSSILNPIVSPADIPNTNVSKRFYEMIGLVDTNTINYQSQNSSVSLNFGGRDLMKLLIEESSYFLELPEQQNATYQYQGLIKNDNPENWGRPFRINSKLQATGEILSTTKSFRTVGEMVSYIISNLASIEIAPDKLFSGYQEQEKRDELQEDGSLKEGFGISKYESIDHKTLKNQLFKAAGIWQIIKLVIDDYCVNDRFIVDQKISTHTGSLISAIQTYIDGRFIEIIGDTYVDQYFLTVRRPPLNKRGVFDYLEKITKTDKEDNGQTITDDMVAGERLSWYDGDAYSWYRINLPLLSNGRTLPVTLFPVVFFREYCEIWGSKALDVHSNYIPLEWNIIAGKNENIHEDQLFEDMCYLIESNAYLPFTRQGVITLKGGETRIKQGTWIRYKPTNELFYVDSVNQSYSINGNNVDRTTIIKVSRGMVEYNYDGQFILPLYFNIIDGLRNEDSTPKPTNEKVESGLQRLNVHFDFDKSVLIKLSRTDLHNKDLISDPEERKRLHDISEKALDDLVEELHSKKFDRLKIYGHTDENGSFDYNIRLSSARATTVMNEIAKRWEAKYKEPFDKTKVDTIGRGESEVIKSNKGLDGDEKRKVDALNRRIEYEITFTKDKNVEKSGEKKPKKENDFSKIRVNQSVFNFFKTRRQKCFRIPNGYSVEDIINDKRTNQPEPIEIVQETKQESVPVKNREKPFTPEMVVDKKTELYRKPYMLQDKTAVRNLKQIPLRKPGT